MSTSAMKRRAQSRRRGPAKVIQVARWRDDAPCTGLVPGTRLSVESNEPFVLHFGHDGWQEVADLDSQPLTPGVHAAELDLKRLGARRSIDFTRRFLGPRGWEQRDWAIPIGNAGAAR